MKQWVEFRTAVSASIVQDCNAQARPQLLLHIAITPNLPTATHHPTSEPELQSQRLKAGQASRRLP